mmetsp:Transcript_47695/g.85870  ORF Transcript_47695/g.85870 Transcript_47695/m.85870 type:complete len:287 (+) Transcript_47695:112-972(+)
MLDPYSAAYQLGRHLVADFLRLVHIESSPLRNPILLEMPDKVGRASIFNLIEEEGLHARIPIRVVVVDLAVCTADVCANQHVANGLSSRSCQLWQDLQCLRANLLSIFEEFGWDVVPCDNHLLAIFRGDCSFVGNGIEELAIEPEAPRFPVASEAFDRLLNNVLGTVRMLLEVGLQDARIVQAIFHSQLAEAQAECHHALLHDEGPPASSLDLPEKTSWTALALLAKDGWRHGDASFHAGLHVLGLDVDEVLERVARHDVARVDEGFGHRFDPLCSLEDGVDHIVA